METTTTKGKSFNGKIYLHDGMGRTEYSAISSVLKLSLNIGHIAAGIFFFQHLN